MNFLLSCISTKHSLLKKHWANDEQTQTKTECPVTALGSMQKPKENQGGLLCLLDDSGQMQASIEMSMPAGMALSDDGVFVASIFGVHKVSYDLSAIEQNAISLPVFNMLHSLSRSRSGYLVASTGLDAILEFTPEGQLLWSWWATDHGFEQTPTSETRIIDKDADHRGIVYGTLAQTTHVNSAAELPDGMVLATLFHQGMVIAIDRASGDWQPLLEGLHHPHSVRVLNQNYITVADTGNGRALLVYIKDRKGTIATQLSADTNWLQDCSYDPQHDRWFLVDGKNSRVILRMGIAGDKELAQLNLNSEWRLYEVLPL